MTNFARLWFTIGWGLVALVSVGVLAIQINLVGLRWLGHVGLGWQALLESFVGASSAAVAVGIWKRSVGSYVLGRVVAWLFVVLLLPVVAALAFFLFVSKGQLATLFLQFLVPCVLLGAFALVNITLLPRK